MSVARFAFGPRLKAHRERQGISLQDIAETTKIGASLLSSLERNDVSQWPKGIYRRAFLRAYARAIDLPFDPIWAEFIQLFPEDGTAPIATLFTEATQLRLTLAGSARHLRRPSTLDVMAAAADLGITLVVGLITSWLTGMSAWMGLALVSLVYAATSTALAGGSLAQWYLRSPRTRRSAVPEHDLVFTHGREHPAGTPTVADDDDAALAVAPQPRPRMFAVASTRVAASSATRERRVADR